MMIFTIEEAVNGYFVCLNDGENIHKEVTETKTDALRAIEKRVTKLIETEFENFRNAVEFK